MVKSIQLNKNTLMKEEAIGYYTIKDELVGYVSKYGIEPGSFLKLTTYA